MACPHRILLLISLVSTCAIASDLPPSLGSAKPGDADSENRIGEAFHFGQGVPTDYKKALEWYRKASADGHAVAPNHIGRIYMNGEGVAKDVEEACRWYRLSSERGDPAGAANAEWCREKGHG